MLAQTTGQEIGMLLEQSIELAAGKNFFLFGYGVI